MFPSGDFWLGMVLGRPVALDYRNKKLKRFLAVVSSVDPGSVWQRSPGPEDPLVTRWGFFLAKTFFHRLTSLLAVPPRHVHGIARQRKKKGRPSAIIMPLC